MLTKRHVGSGNEIDGDWGECVQAPIARGFAHALSVQEAPVPTSMLHGDHQNEAAPEKYGGQKDCVIVVSKLLYLSILRNPIRNHEED